MKKIQMTILYITLGLLVLSSVSGCKTQIALNQPETFQVIATTSILADVVKQVGGDLVAVTSLVPLGSNEHEYQPVPRDIVAISEADLLFEVGLGLEEFLPTILDSTSSELKIITVSDGIIPLESSHDAEEDHDGDHESGDPHVWLDPGNVVVWVENIYSALSALDPTHQAAYRENSDAYIAQLRTLNEWIASQVSSIPSEKRLIVTDHLLFGYFAKKYGFEVVGAVIPSFSSSAQPSAQQLAALEDAIREYNVKVILVGSTVNPALSQRVAEDTGIKLVPFYTGSLSEADGPASTYLDYMHFNVNAIMQALAE